jgi:hypothetical protein
MFTHRTFVRRANIGPGTGETKRSGGTIEDDDIDNDIDDDDIDDDRLVT